MDPLSVKIKHSVFLQVVTTAWIVNKSFRCLLPEAVDYCLTQVNSKALFIIRVNERLDKIVYYNVVYVYCNKAYSLCNPLSTPSSGIWPQFATCCDMLAVCSISCLPISCRVTLVAVRQNITAWQSVKWAWIYMGKQITYKLSHCGLVVIIQV